jgi:hypothetical protein
VSANFSRTMCHSRHHHRRAVAPPAETAPRRDPSLRASDAERETTVTQLREHGAAGRLDVEELEQRVGAAYSARTHGELGALLADLPAAPAQRRAVAPHPGVAWHGHGRHGQDWRAFFAVNALLVAIWAVGGAGYFWPAWVMVWWAFALVMKSAPVTTMRFRSTSRQ